VRDVNDDKMDGWDETILPVDHETADEITDDVSCRHDAGAKVAS
jgi:hypothetical protein